MSYTFDAAKKMRRISIKACMESMFTDRAEACWRGGGSTTYQTEVFHSNAPFFVLNVLRDGAKFAFMIGMVLPERIQSARVRDGSGKGVLHMERLKKRYSV